MRPTNPETLSFLMPGLLHQFGNAFLAIQSAAFLIAEGSAQRSRDTVNAAVQRGTANLDLMRFLAGESAPAAANGLAVLERLIEVLRVPLREAQHGLAVRVASSAGTAMVDPSHLVVLLGEAVVRLVRSLPPGVYGTVVIGADTPNGRGLGVSVRFEFVAGALPFPIAVADLPEQLRSLAARRGAAVQCFPAEAGVALRFAVEPLVRAMEA